jgi:DNA-binding winged helix-turn-helix (wHTH) protein
VSSAADFRFGDWLVRPASHALQRGDQTVALEPRLMQVLVLLCSAPGQVFSADELLQRCWDDAELGDNPVHKCLALLRKALGDAASSPRYIRTLRGQGYCTVAPVEVLDAPAPAMPWTGASPFVGLRAFDARHAPVFCGREHSVQQLADSLARQIEQPGPTLLLGASGSGKSSLVQAGLLPRLLRGELAPRLSSQAGLHLDEVVAERWDQEFAAALLDLEQADGQPCFAGHSAETLAALLRQAPDGLDPLQAALAGPGQRLLWLDKFEALLNPAQGLHAVLDQVLALLARLDRCEGLLLLLICRNDYYPSLAQQPWLLASKAWGGHVDLLRPHAAELAQMLRQPAQIAGLRYGLDEQGRRLDDLLLAELQTGADALPLLQHMLAALYERRSPEGELRASDYQQLGGLEGAIATHAEAVVAALGEAEQSCLPGVLARLVVVAEEAEACTSQAARWRDLPGEAERHLVRALIEARLFTACLVQGEPGFRLSHEALLRRWPRVAEWIAAHLQALRARARLEAAAQRWAEQGSRSDQLIPRGRPLEEAALLRAHGLPLSSTLQQHIQTSTQRARRQRLQMRALWTSLLLLALAALGFAGIAQRQALAAAEQRESAEGLVGFMVGDLADALRPLGKLEVLERISDRALSQLGHASAGKPETGLQQGRALLVLAEVAYGRGQVAQVQQALDGAGERLLPLDRLREPSVLAQQVQQQLGALAYWRGQLALDQGRLADAESAFRAYLAHSKTLMQLAPEDRKAWIELSYALNNLGTLALGRQDFEPAAAAFGESLLLKRRALNAQPEDAELRADLADTLSWLGSAQLRQGRPAAARQAYADEAEMLERLHAEQPQAGRWMNRLAGARHRLGELEAALGDPDGARASMSRALQLARRAQALDPDNLALSVDLQRILLDLSELEGRPIPVASREVMREALQRNPSDLRLRLLALRVLVAEQPEAELPAELLPGLAGLHDGLPGYALALLRQSVHFQRAGDAARARQRCERAAELLAPRQAATQDHRLLQRWVQASDCLGQPALEALARLQAQGVSAPRRSE